jgi:hypothetical protein
MSSFAPTLEAIAGEKKKPDSPRTCRTIAMAG